MNAVQRYLYLGSPYAEFLGLAWAVDENVLEFTPGRVGTCDLSATSHDLASRQVADYTRKVLGFGPEIADFLEGFASQRRLIHFGYMAHLLFLLRLKRSARSCAERRWRLAELYEEHGRSLRFAGALCGRLCAIIPDALNAEALPEICAHLRRLDFTIHWQLLEQCGAAAPPKPEYPPFRPEAFEAYVLEELDGLGAADAIAWLKHGRGLLDEAGKSLARALPVTLAGRLAGLLERPRLRRAHAFLPQLSGALTLPPRRLTYQDLPLGGYTTVTTRGKLEQILLSQFALDEWDFFRRLLEKELLYFQREDPNAPTRQELVVLLDQGMRTWGDVRLVLGAALLALGQHASRKHMPFFLATTGMPNLLDPVGVGPEELGTIVEASDLSPNPALSLEAILERPGPCPRDIVVLTHPRNLDEADVRTAARRVGRDSRLFALTLDRLGQAFLHEMRHGVPIALRQFHIDLTRGEPAAQATPADVQGWSGDVEPVGFPFGFGLDGRVPAQGFDFDSDENYLLTACRQGLLHLWNLEGSLVEILPRGFQRDRVLTEVHAVLGVEDGFVVIGRCDSQWLAAHYHLARRVCRVHPLGTGLESSHWEYSPEHHCLLILSQDAKGGCSLDLATGERFATSIGAGTTRTRAAWDDWERGQVRRRFLSLLPSPANAAADHGVYLDWGTGEVYVSLHAVAPSGHAWLPFRPLADGKPLLRDAQLLSAQFGGLHLALTVVHSRAQHTHVYVFESNGVPRSVVTMPHGLLGSRLSRRGDLFAWQMNSTVLGYGSLHDTARRRTRVGGFAQRLAFRLGEQELIIFPGTRQLFHCLNWGDGPLTHTTGYEPCPTKEKNLAVPTGQLMPSFLEYDRKRWAGSAQRNVTVANDLYGHLAVFDREQRLVCMFIAFRRKLAGWMPDGTCFGPPSMTGKAPHPEAMSRFGQALRRAS